MDEITVTIWRNLYNALNRSVLVTSLDNNYRAKVKFILSVLYSNGATDQWINTLKGWESDNVTIKHLYEWGCSLLKAVGILDQDNKLIEKPIWNDNFELQQPQEQRVNLVRTLNVTPSDSFNIWKVLVANNVNPYLFEVFHYGGNSMVMYDKELISYSALNAIHVYHVHIKECEELALTNESVEDAWVIINILNESNSYPEFVNNLEKHYGFSFYHRSFDAANSMGKILDNYFLSKQENITEQGVG